MIKIKHFMEAVEPDDGQRIWVEPIGLTRELREWCAVSDVLTHLGPPMEVWTWFGEHPDDYDRFRAEYHDSLTAGPYKAALQKLAQAGIRENFTLLHQSDNPNYNTAVALHEYLSELQAYCTPDDPTG